MKKNIILTLILVSILSVWFIFFRENKSDSEQDLLANTYNISKDYLSLRYRTEQNFYFHGLILFATLVH